MTQSACDVSWCMASTLLYGDVMTSSSGEGYTAHTNLQGSGWKEPGSHWLRRRIMHMDADRLLDMDHINEGQFCGKCSICIFSGERVLNTSFFRCENQADRSITIVRTMVLWKKHKRERTHTRYITCLCNIYLFQDQELTYDIQGEIWRLR